MSKFFIYGNSGGIEKVKEDIKKEKEIYYSINQVFDKIYDEWFPTLETEDLRICSYTYDDRIGYNVYMITSSIFDGEDCGHDSFVSYLIDLEENIDKEEDKIKRRVCIMK